MAQDVGPLGVAGEDAGDLHSIDGDWLGTFARFELTASKSGEGQRVGLAVKARPIGDNVRDDAGVVLCAQLRGESCGPHRVDAVHPRVAGEADVEEAPKRCQPMCTPRGLRSESSGRAHMGEGRRCRAVNAAAE